MRPLNSHVTPWNLDTMSWSVFYMCLSKFLGNGRRFSHWPRSCSALDRIWAQIFRKSAISSARTQWSLFNICNFNDRITDYAMIRSRNFTASNYVATTDAMKGWCGLWKLVFLSLLRLLPLINRLLPVMNSEPYFCWIRDEIHKKTFINIGQSVKEVNVHY